MTFSLDSLAMEAAHAALALADSTNPVDWVAPVQAPFNYSWGRAQSDVTFNESMEAARRGRGRPKKEVIDGVGSEAKSVAEKKPPIRGRGRPPRSAEGNTFYDKFPLPPGLQAGGWPPTAPSYLRLLGEQPSQSHGHVVDLTRETPPPHSGVRHNGHFGTGSCCVGNPCQPSGGSNGIGSEGVASTSVLPGVSGANNVVENGAGAGVGSATSNGGHVGDRNQQLGVKELTSQLKLHPTYPPAFLGLPTTGSCFPGKQIINSHSSLAITSASGTISSKTSISSDTKAKQVTPISESIGTSGPLAIPKPIILGGTNVGCPLCFKIFGSKGLLTQHMLVHTDIRKHACLYCDKAFKQQSHLKAHVRIHTGDRPFKCTMPNCDRDFVQMANLQFHLRNHDAQVKRAAEEKNGYRDRVRCPVCYKAFDSSLGLERHMYEFHEPAVIDQELSLSNSNSST